MVTGCFEKIMTIKKIMKATRLQNSRFFSEKSVKKSVKRCVRVLRALSHARRALCFQPTGNTQKYGLFCSLSGH